MNSHDSTRYVMDLCSGQLWCVLFMSWRSWARLVNSWARVVCVLIMSCVAERAHVHMCSETRLDIVAHYVIVLFHAVTCSTDAEPCVGRFNLHFCVVCSCSRESHVISASRDSKSWKSWRLDFHESRVVTTSREVIKTPSQVVPTISTTWKKRTITYVTHASLVTLVWYTCFVQVKG